MLLFIKYTEVPIGLLFYIHGCLNGKYRIYLQEYLPKLTVNNLRYSNSQNLKIPQTRTKLFQSSFFVRSTRLWNSLSNETKEITNYNIFKNHLKSTYFFALHNNFDIEIISTWRSIWSHCNSVKNLQLLNCGICC